MLRVAVIAAVMSSATSFAATLTKDNISYPQDDTTTSDVKEGISYLNVGMENETDTWQGNLVVGDLADVQGDVDNVGAFNDSWGFVTPNGGNSNKTITSSLKITGSLTLQGSGKIVLGGQSSSKYHGIEVTESITVTGGSLKSTKIITNDLTITDGIVNTHTSNCNAGNSGLYAFSSTGKQSTIKNSLTQEGGEAVFGYGSKMQGIGVGNHCYVGFGTSGQSATITQTGGKMLFAGDIAAQAGLTIGQELPKSGATEQSMIIRDCMWLFGSGETSVTQKSDLAFLEIGKIASTNSKEAYEISISQSGKGTINLVYGSSFAGSGAISVTQSGEGVINIGGGHSSEVFNTKYSSQNGDVALSNAITPFYAGTALHTDGFTSKNTVYTIKQTNKGTINILGEGGVGKRNGSLVTQLACAATILCDAATVCGTLNVTSGATFGIIFNEISQGDSEYVTVGDTGAWNLEEGSTFGINFSQAALEKISTSDDIAATPNTIDFEFNVRVADGADAAALKNTAYKLLDMDERLWSLNAGTKWVQDGTKTYLQGSVVYNPWISVTEDTSESFVDVSDFLKVGLDIDGKDVAISGSNSHSYGTKIKDATVTLNNTAALGKGEVMTTGTTILKGSSKTTYYNLPSTIQNSGNLTLSSLFNVSTLETASLPDFFVDVEGNISENGNGFRHYDCFEVQVVENGTGASLTVAEGYDKIKHGSLIGELETDESGAYTGVASFVGGIDYDTYVSNDANAELKVSEIQDASGDQTTTIVMTKGSLTADESVNVNLDGSSLVVSGGSTEVGGELKDTDVDAQGGSISADIIGASDVTVTGDTTISGANNSYSGGTVIDGGKLTVASDKALGKGVVVLKNRGTLDLSGKAVSNYIKVEGCTLAGAGAYSGKMDVSGNLLLQDATTAAKVVMLGAGKISGAPLTTSDLDVNTDGNASIGGDLTINDNGTITLNNGSLLEVGGSLTLGNGAKLVLNGDYAVGTSLLSSTGTLTMGDVSLVYGDSTVELEKQGNSLVLVSKFKQNKATATTLSNWGIATASRAVVNAVRGQRSNTGCIANGKGTAWVASLGSKHEINGSDIDISGAAVGADMKVGRNSRIGIALGYAEGEVQPAGFSQVDQEGSYLVVYGEHGLKKLSATSCLSMDWVAAYGTTDSEVGGLKWEQDSLQLNSRVNWNKKVGKRTTMSVFGGVEYFANNSDTVDGVKTGSIQNLRGEIGVGARYVAWGIPAVTDGKSGLVLAKGCEKLVLNGEVRYMNDMVRSNPVVRMNGLSGMGDNPGRQGIGIEAGATYRIGERWSASANYGFNTMEDSKEHRLNIGAAYTF